MLPQLKEIIVNTVLCTFDTVEWRPGGVGIYGFDVFPDENLKLWLIEVNKCPAMEYSTQVTSDIVPKFMKELVQLLLVEK